MQSRYVRLAAPLVLAATLLAGGCGSADKKDSPSSAGSPSASPSPSKVTLKGDTAAALQAKDGTQATVVENPADAPGAAAATEAPQEPSAKEKLVEGLANDTGLEIDLSGQPDFQYVTVRSADGKLSMDVPASWTYTEYGNGLGGESFGALDGSSSSFTQYVVHGTQTTTLDESTERIATETLALNPSCKAAEVRPYEDAQFIGKGRSFECANDQSVVGYSLQGKGDKSFYNGYFLFRVSDAEGVAALQRAILSLEVS